MNINRIFSSLKGSAAFTAALLACALLLQPLAVCRAAGSQTVTDGLGRTIVSAHGFSRIITLDPAAAEILFSVGAGSRVVGVGTWTDFPAEATKLPKLDGISPSREMLTSLHPDVIVIWDEIWTRARADQKSKLYGIPIYVLNGGSYTGVEQDIAKVGAAFGKPGPTAQTLRSMRAAREDVVRRVKNLSRPTVFDIVCVKPLMTAGKGSYFSDLIALAGGVDTASNAPKYSVYPLEQLLAVNPQVIVCGDGSVADAQHALGGLHLKAVDSHRLVSVSEDWTSRPGPRLALGLRELAQRLHPEAFAKR